MHMYEFVWLPCCRPIAMAPSTHATPKSQPHSGIHNSDVFMSLQRPETRMVPGGHRHVEPMGEYNCGAVADSGKPSASQCSGLLDLTLRILIYWS